MYIAFFTLSLFRRIAARRLLFSCCLLAAAQLITAQNYASWSDYGGTADSAQYSALTQINRSNVNKLRVAWSYPTADGAKYFFGPLMADGRVYVLAKNNSIVALDAVSGKEIWVHATDPNTSLITNRGINYWQSKDRIDRRLLFACNNFLQAVDARTGRTIATFGKDGRVDLREGFGRDPASLSLVQSTTPGRVFENLLILGSATNQGYGSAPGDIRAFDVRTGRQVWAFHTIPHPGEFGYDTWPKDAWKTAGGANSWSELSLDVARGIVYIPTASPKYNFYGADRAGANLFGDCLLALDARTGKRLWHFQMVHHDIWDYDNGTAPKLLSVRHTGKLVDVVAQAGKEGFVWVFNRSTGEPLWPIEERSVPRSHMPGEQTWPTQPFPMQPPPFARQKFTASDLSPFIEDPRERNYFRQQIESAHNDGLFTPPEMQNTLEMPGNNGGANWGGAAVDPSKGALYVVSKDLPAMLKLERKEEHSPPRNASARELGEFLFQANCQACHGADRKGQPPGVPSLVDVNGRLARPKLLNTLRQGEGSMPAFPTLTGNQLEALLTFLSEPPHVPRSAPPRHTLPSSLSAKDPSTPVRYFSGFGFMITSSGLSPIKPPWTSLTAYNLNSGAIQWKIPLGEVPELAAKGIKNTGTHFPKSGPVVTAGGLVFVATRDRKVRAFDQNSGKILWETEVDAGVEGIPAVYQVRGREYLVVCAASPSETGQPAAHQLHGAYIAFALPDNSK